MTISTANYHDENASAWLVYINVSRAEIQGFIIRWHPHKHPVKMKRMAKSMRPMILLIFSLFPSKVYSNQIGVYVSGCNSAISDISTDPCSNCKLPTSASTGSCRPGCVSNFISSEWINSGTTQLIKMQCDADEAEYSDCPSGKLCCKAPAGSYCPGTAWYQNEEDTDAGKATVGLKCEAGKFTSVVGQTSCSECCLLYTSPSPRD